MGDQINKNLDEEEVEKEKQAESSLFSLGVAAVDLISEGLSPMVEVMTPIVDFLKDKYHLGSDTASEIASKLPESVVEQIEKFDGTNMTDITTSIMDTIKSIELPDIDFPDLDF